MKHSPLTTLLLLLAFLALPLTHAKIPPIQLEPAKQGDDCSAQLMEKFNQLLQSNKELKKQMDSYEAVSKESFGGRYGGPEARPLLLKSDLHVDFDRHGGTTKFQQTLVFYYSFTGGYRRGTATDPGVFALFEIKGEIIEKNAPESPEPGAPKPPTITSNITATFQGFSKTLTLPKR